MGLTKLAPKKETISSTNYSKQKSYIMPKFRKEN